MMSTPPPDPDRALAAALNAVGERGLTREELAAEAGLPAAVVEAIEREGLLVADGRDRFDADAVAVLRAGRTLLDVGVPLAEVLDMARTADAALRPVAEASVDTFVRFVRDPVHASAETEEEAAARLLDAYESMLPAAGNLIGLHFRRLLVTAARQRAAEALAGEGP